jgi:hypothetical protein
MASSVRCSRFFFELGDPLLALGERTRHIRDAIDLPFNQLISVLRLRNAHHRGVQGRRTSATQADREPTTIWIDTSWARAASSA